MKGHSAWNKGILRELQPNYGKKLSDETKNKIRLSHLGKKLSEEHKRRLSESHKGNVTWISGKHHSQETRDKISKNHTYHRPWNKGLTKNNDIRIKHISLLQTGRQISIKTRDNISNGKKGKTAWNKGKICPWVTKHNLENNPAKSKESRIKIGNTLREGHTSGRIKLTGAALKCSLGLIKREDHPMYGRTHSEYSRKKMSMSQRGITFFDKFIWDKHEYILFTDLFKKSIRKRDNQVCMNCGIHREKLNESLSVHHINYDKKVSIKENCISLCKNCHALTNHNRKYWQQFFQLMLSDRYGYCYNNSKIEVSI